MAGCIVLSTVDNIWPLVLAINTYPKCICAILGYLSHLQYCAHILDCLCINHINVISFNNLQSHLAILTTSNHPVLYAHV